MKMEAQVSEMRLLAALEEGHQRPARRVGKRPRGLRYKLDLNGKPGTVVATCTLTPISCTRSAAVKSQMQVYRGKAEDCARRTMRAKSSRESRRYRQLADMYRALALGEEPENVPSPTKIVKTSAT
jgi:hypothetical protein